MEELIWKYPCYTQEAGHNQKLRVVRHVAHRGLDTMKRQFNLAHNNMNQNYPTVEKLYHNVNEKLNGQYNLPWLPEQQLDWYNRGTLCLDKAKKLALILPKLDDELQIFAITFYSLKHINLTTNSNREEVAKRNVFVDKMYNLIRGFLCELVTVMEKHNMTRPLIHEAEEVRRNMQWNQNVDFTEMVTQDSGIIRRFQSFIEEWRAATAHAAKSGDGVCDPGKTKPVKPKSGKRKANKGKRKNGGKKRVGGRKQGHASQVSGNGKKSPPKLGRKKINNSRRKLTGNKQRKTQ